MRTFNRVGDVVMIGGVQARLIDVNPTTRRMLIEFGESKVRMWCKEIALAGLMNGDAIEDVAGPPRPRRAITLDDL